MLKRVFDLFECLFLFVGMLASDVTFSVKNNKLNEHLSYKLRRPFNTILHNPHNQFKKRANNNIGPSAIVSKPLIR